MNKASSAKVLLSEGCIRSRSCSASHETVSVSFSAKCERTRNPKHHVDDPLVVDAKKHSKTSLRAGEDADTSISGSHQNGHRYRDLDSCRASQKIARVWVVELGPTRASTWEG